MANSGGEQAAGIFPEDAISLSVSQSAATIGRSKLAARNTAMKSKLLPVVLLSLFACGACAAAEPLKSLTVCADPGNMPLSNDKGEGFENKIAQLIGQTLQVNVSYYWRPSIERGLMRTTLSEGACDVWMDMASDTEGAITTTPLYRSTFVFAYRNDRGYDFKTFGDPRLQKLRIGVFQVSAIRQAMTIIRIAQMISTMAAAVPSSCLVSQPQSQPNANVPTAPIANRSAR